MKKPWLAFLRNFLFAGAGFAYLGQWMWAVVNFFVAVALGFVIVHYIPASLSTASAVVAAVNGSIAMSAAKSMNAKR